MTDEMLNMLVGGPWYDRAAYFQLVKDEGRGVDPAQWRGWPRLVYDNQGHRWHRGVW